MDENSSAEQAGNPPAARRFRFRFARLRKETSGGVAIEFAVLGPVFVGLLYGIFETGILFLKMTAMDAGVDEAKRLVMTGQVSAAGTAAQRAELFRKGFCRGAGWIISCNDVVFDVRAFDSFSSAMTPTSVSGGALDGNNLQFQPGRPNQIVIIRAYHVTSAVTAALRNDLGNRGKGSTVLVGSAAIKNEP